MPRPTTYPWPELAASGELFTVEFPYRRETPGTHPADKMLGAAAMWARRNGHVVRTKKTVVRTIDQTAEDWRVRAHVQFGETAEATPLFRLAEGTLMVCPTCGAEVARHKCGSCGGCLACGATS